ncbi:hypothetical protein KP509_09G052700 [Ceratopteris richardii]|nr:hypothetical protein KP509_09G052700 [Ceratopteris richardii]
MMTTEESGCTIVNKTDKEVVVRAKYRDVWEGELWRLPGHGGQMVVPRRFLPQKGEPYNRLGAFVDSGLPFSSSPLLIPSADLIRHRCLAISLAISHCTVPGFPALDIAPTISV